MPGLPGNLDHHFNVAHIFATLDRLEHNDRQNEVPFIWQNAIKTATLHTLHALTVYTALYGLILWELSGDYGPLVVLCQVQTRYLWMIY